MAVSVFILTFAAINTKRATMEENRIVARWEQKLESYSKALRRLAEIVNCANSRELSDFEKDGLVQRFEFTHEMAWKLMMSFCRYQSPEMELYGSKDSTRWAFSHDLIADGDTWMQMIQSRNSTSHNYDGVVADQVVQRVVKDYFPCMVAFHDKMQSLSSEPKLNLF